MGERDPLIAVVGTSGAGKSTLVQRLSERGYSAYAVAQEHSLVPTLWRRKEPDLLVYLECSYEAVEQRRTVSRRFDWLAAERQRLAHARQHAHLSLNTDELQPQDVVQAVEELVDSYTADESGRDVC